MKLAVLFLIAAIGITISAFQTQHLVITVLLANCAISFLMLSLAYFMAWPGVFLKRGDGTLSIFIYPLMWPYFLMNHCSLFLFRLTSNEALFNEIVPGLYLGGRLRAANKSVISPLAIKSVLDVTGEFGEIALFKRGLLYRCVPVLDRSAPNPHQLNEGAHFIKDQLPKGAMYVHCALGHSRSATFVASYLLLAGIVNDPKEAIAFIKNKRPGVNPHFSQIEALRQFMDTTRESAKR